MIRNNNIDKWNYLKENYIDRGLKIFPVEVNGKKPLIENWMNNCSCDYFQVLYWYNSLPNCNWGLPCTPNDIFVLDLDVHNENKNGIKNFAKLQYDIGTTIIFNNEPYLDDYLIQKTPSGGVHIIYKTDNELKNVCNGSNVFKDYSGIDIRTDGYILVEPSIINDKVYYFPHADRYITNIGKSLKKFILENTNTKTDIKKEPYKKPTNVEVGDRDNQLFLYIHDLYYKTRLDYDEILCLANYFNENILEEPFSEKIVKYKVNKVFDKERGEYITIKLYED